MFGFRGLAAATVMLSAFSTPVSAFTVLGSEIEAGSYVDTPGRGLHYRRHGGGGPVGGFGGRYAIIEGIGSVFDVFAEVGKGADMPPSFSVTSGIMHFGDFRDIQLTALFSNAFPILDAAMQSYVSLTGGMVRDEAHIEQWYQLSAYSESLQMLTWTIVENNSLIVAPGDPSTPFGFWENHSMLNDPFTVQTILGWADNINTGAWAPKEGVNLYYAISSDSSQQNRIWATMDSPTGGVPEAATWAMMIAGFGMVGVAMRRREALAA